MTQNRSIIRFNFNSDILVAMIKTNLNIKKMKIILIRYKLIDDFHIEIIDKNSC